MTPLELEKVFNRSCRYSFSKKKLLLVFPVLCICGFLAVICRTISLGAGQWVQMSLTFLPIFLCCGLLMAVGIVLIRLYHSEVRGVDAPYFKVIRESKNLILGIPYLAVPLIFSYLILWMLLGIFYLLRSIPHIGEVMSAIFSFGPFLLVLGSIALSFFSLLILFYFTPAAALKSDISPKLADEVFQEFKFNPFLSFIMPILALFPILLVIGMLSLAAVVTELLYIEATGGLSIALKWFFIMIPFSALLTPAVIFFFNFSAESHVFLQRRIQEQ